MRFVDGRCLIEDPKEEEIFEETERSSRRADHRRFDEVFFVNEQCKVKRSTPTYKLPFYIGVRCGPKSQPATRAGEAGRCVVNVTGCQCI